MMGSSVCSLGGSLATSLAAGFTVYVPYSLVNAYQSAWSGYSIVGQGSLITSGAYIVAEKY
jgi:hypothetical protein